MSNRYSVGQMNQLGDGLEAACYSVYDVTKLRSPEVLSQVKLVLMGLATIVRADLKFQLPKSFNPHEFIGKGWSVWKGPVDGNGLEGEEDCVLEPDIVDFEKIVLETHLQEGETSVYGEEKMKRARAGKNQQLGGRAFLALWENWQECKSAGKPEDSILEKLRRSGKIKDVIYFFGLGLRPLRGRRSVLSLCFDGGEWDWSSCWLVNPWGSDSPSVSLASVN